jgi:hypothetical protein
MPESRTKRKIRRRLIGAIAGLVIGWCVAGAAFDQVPVHADSAPTDKQVDKNDHVEGDRKPGENKSGKHDHDHDAHATDPATAHLVPGEGQTKWFGCVLTLAACLFAAALAVGVTIGEAKVPVEEDDHHDDGHGGHDSH